MVGQLAIFDFRISTDVLRVSTYGQTLDAQLQQFRAEAPARARAFVRCITRADTTTAGRLMLTVLGGLAEFERELIRAHTGAGREPRRGERRRAYPRWRFCGLVSIISQDRQLRVRPFAPRTQTFGVSGCRRCLRRVAPARASASSSGMAPTPSRLLRLSKNLPHDWEEQRCFLGFAA